MASAGIPEAVRRVFTEVFTARDIAEPLASFDDGTPTEVVRAAMANKGIDVAGVRSSGRVVGFIERDKLGDGVCGDYLRPTGDSTVLDASVPLLTAVLALDRTPFLFVTVLGYVGGIITRSDLQKPPVRMWLFGLVTLIEMRTAELIERYCPNGTWMQYVSEGRLQKAQQLLAERERRNQSVELLDCLQFADKGQIVARHEEIRKQTVFTSRSRAEEAFKHLEHLRNNLAHSQDIVTGDWGTIIQLCEFVMRN